MNLSKNEENNEQLLVLYGFAVDCRESTARSLPHFSNYGIVSLSLSHNSVKAIIDVPQSPRTLRQDYNLQKHATECRDSVAPNMLTFFIVGQVHCIVPIHKEAEYNH